MMIIICSKTSSTPHALTDVVSLEECHNSGFMATVMRLNGHQVRLITSCQQCSIYAHLLLATVASLDTGQLQEGWGMIIAWRHGDSTVAGVRSRRSGVIKDCFPRMKMKDEAYMLSSLQTLCFTTENVSRIPFCSHAVCSFVDWWCLDSLERPKIKTLKCFEANQRHNISTLESSFA